MKTTLLALSFLFACPDWHGSLVASPLSDSLEESGVTWMIGSWATADGAVKVTYEWRLDRHAIGVKFSGGGRDAEGMIVLKPGSKQAMYVAADSNGGVSKGAWSEYQGHPLLKTTYSTADKELKTATEHIKVSADTMAVKLYKQNDSGEPGEVMLELEFNRVK